MECQEEPDSGQSAGVAGHDWNSVDRFYLTNFTYTCPFGDTQSILLEHPVMYCVPRPGCERELHQGGEQHVQVPGQRPHHGLLDIQRYQPATQVHS